LGIDGRLGAAFATAALGTGAFAGWLAFGPGGDTMTLYVDDLGTVVAAAAATVLSAQTSGCTPSTRTR
jgi:hypothetical protein